MNMQTERRIASAIAIAVVALLTGRDTRAGCVLPNGDCITVASEDECFSQHHGHFISGTCDDFVANMDRNMNANATMDPAANNNENSNAGMSTNANDNQNGSANEPVAEDAIFGSPCCIPDPVVGARCVLLTEPDCLAQGGVFSEDADDCDDVLTCGSTGTQVLGLTTCCSGFGGFMMTGSALAIFRFSSRRDSRTKKRTTNNK